MAVCDNAFANQTVVYACDNAGIVVSARDRNIVKSNVFNFSCAADHRKKSANGDVIFMTLLRDLRVFDGVTIVSTRKSAGESRNARPAVCNRHANRQHLSANIDVRNELIAVRKHPAVSAYFFEILSVAHIPRRLRSAVANIARNIEACIVFIRRGKIDRHDARFICGDRPCFKVDHDVKLALHGVGQLGVRRRICVFQRNWKGLSNIHIIYRVVSDGRRDLLVISDNIINRNSTGHNHDCNHDIHKKLFH